MDFATWQLETIQHWLSRAKVHLERGDRARQHPAHRAFLPERPDEGHGFRAIFRRFRSPKQRAAERTERAERERAFEVERLRDPTYQACNALYELARQAGLDGSAILRFRDAPWSNKDLIAAVRVVEQLLLRHGGLEPTPGAVQAISRERAEERVLAWFNLNADEVARRPMDVTVRLIAEQTGVPKSTVQQTTTWRAFCERRRGQTHPRQARRVDIPPDELDRRFAAPEIEDVDDDRIDGDDHDVLEMAKSRIDSLSALIEEQTRDDVSDRVYLNDR